MEIKRQKTNEIQAYHMLPKEIWHLVLDNFQKSAESVFIQLVCKAWKSIIHVDKCFKLAKVIGHYAEIGNFPALVWFK
jgi:hypothetical protein